MNECMYASRYAWGGHFVKNFLISVSDPRDSEKKLGWFSCKKTSQRLKHLNFKCENGKIVLRLCTCSMRTLAFEISKKCEWKSDLTITWTPGVTYSPRLYSECSTAYLTSRSYSIICTVLFLQSLKDKRILHFPSLLSCWSNG